MNLEEKIQSFLLEATDEEKKLLELSIDALERKRQNDIDCIYNWLGIEFEFTDERALEASMAITPFTLNRLGIAHGGITATFIDISMGRLLLERLIPEGKYAVTTELKINYISPGVGEYLKAETKIVHVGNHLAVLECKVYNDRQKLVAMATGSFFIVG